MEYQWTVYLASLDPTSGREQAGERPVLVVSAEPLNRRYDVVTVLPITSRKNERLARLGDVLLPAGIGGLSRDSFALCHQIRAIDKSRLIRIIGYVGHEDIRTVVRHTISECLDVD